MDDERELLKGNTPTLVLAVLEDSPLHGYAIAREINKRSGDALRCKQGTLYPALHALERDGLISGAPTALSLPAPPGLGAGGTAHQEASYPTGRFFGYARYATGNIGGRQINGTEGGGPRHSGGADYVACDGHVVWLRPEQVSGGKSQPTGKPNCAQDDAAAGCGGVDRAAGTADGKYALTFSIH